MAVGRRPLFSEGRASRQAWIAERKLCAADYLFPSRIRSSRHLSTRQYARIVRGWVSLIGLNPRDYGTHSLRRTKATLIYRRTKNLRAVQLLLDHAKIESNVRYLGVEVDDALEIAEHTEIQPHRFAFRNLTDHQRAKGTRFRAPFALSAPPKNTGP